MITHCIFMCSSYDLKTRIVLDYCYKDKIDEEEIAQTQEYIKKIYDGMAPISMHYLKTDSTDWKSVIDTDLFFKDVKVVKTKEEFVKIIIKDKSLLGIDVARYILTKIPCTHKKLEKLVYFCYADYICEFKEKLFNEDIYAFKYGPVSKSVYKQYRKKRGFFKEEEDDTQEYSYAKSEMPAKSRIISSIDGVRKVFSIDKTLEKYGKLNTNELVSLTHKTNSPWYVSGGNTGKIIKDEIIISNHVYE